MTEQDMMPARTRLDVDSDVLMRMGAAVKESKGALSPFRSDVDALPGDVRDRLVGDGVIDSTGAIRAENARAMGLLASASRATRVQLVSGGGVFEYAAYFPPDSDAAVSLKTVGHALRIEDPAATDDTISYLANMIGSSIVVGTEFEAALTVREALVFGALVDECRKSMLKQLIDGKKQDRPLTVEAIEDSLRNGGAGMLRMVSLVRGAVGDASPIPSNIIAEAVEALVKAGHATRKGKGFSIGEAGVSLARNFLSIESVLRLTAGREIGRGKVDHVSFTCGIAGLHDILSIEYVDGRVHLETLTSRRLLDIVRFFLTVGNAVPVRESSRAEVRFCGRCGRQRGVDDRFCAGCGSALQDAGA